MIDYFNWEGRRVLATETARGYGVHFEDQSLVEWYSSRHAFEEGDGPYNMSRCNSPEEAVRVLLKS